MEQFWENRNFYLSTINANLLFIEYGSVLAWNSPVLPKLRSNDTTVNPLEEPISIIQVSMCTSAFPIGALLGVVLVSKLPDILGRKKMIMYLAIVSLLSIILMNFINRFWMYLTLYIVLTTSVSASTTIVPTYISEIAEKQNRGKFGATILVSKTIGQLYTFLIGPETNFRIYSMCCTIPLIFHLVLSYFTQESPIFLMLRGDREGAIKNMKKMRKTLTETDIEIQLAEHEKLMNSQNLSACKVLFRTRAGKKGFLLALVARSMTILSGILVIIMFLSSLIEETGINMSSYILSLLVIGIKIATSIVCSIIVEKVGRRFLMLIGCFCCSATTFTLGAYYYCKQINVAIPPIIPVISIFLYVAFFIIGLGGVPYIIISEVLDNETRVLGTSIVFVIADIMMIAMTFSFPIISYYFGVGYCMFGFSTCCFVGGVITFFYLPETKGKTFGEIQKLLENKDLNVRTGT